MALGIAALVGVRGSAESVRRQFLQDTRALLAADVVVQSPTYPTDEQRSAVAQLSSGGTTSTLVVETLTMASSEKGERPQMVDVTVVDPSAVPVLRPRLTAAATIAASTAGSQLHCRLPDAPRTP